MAQKTYVEGFEELVLRAIYKLGDNAYGVTIWQELEAAGRKASLGGIYAVAERLEEHGLLRSRQGEATAERGGKAKTFYEVTGAGVDAVLEADRIRGALRPDGAQMGILA